MNQKELVATFRWSDNVGNLLPTEINRILGLVAEGLGKASGKPIQEITFEFQGKTHTVPAAALAT